MKRFGLAVLVVAVSMGCSGDTRQNSITAPGTPRIAPLLSASARGHAMRYDMSKRDPILSAIAFGLAPRGKLDGAEAWLVRDPASAQPSLVILTREGVTDNAYLIAQRLMTRDITSHPTTSGRRVIKIFRDRHVIIEEGGTSRTAYFDMSVGNLTHDISPEMLRRHDAATKLHVDGVGEVRVVFLPTKVGP